MIASLRGTVVALGADHTVIEAAGVGYLVFAPRSVVQQLGAGEQAFLHTRLIIREDAMTLYGFRSTDERSWFDLLMTVTGVGPKVALAVLGAVPLDQLQIAIANENVTLLAQVPGIGKKTAARLILDLKPKVGQLSVATDATPQASVVGRVNAEVQSVLQSLGYSALEAQAAVSALPSDAPTDLEERLREALRYFGGM